MIKHVLKLMWNQKKRNALIIVELMVVFVVLFAAVYFLSSDLSKLLTPMAIKDKNIAGVGFYTTDTNTAEVRKIYPALKAYLKSLPYVEEVSYTGNSVPFEDSYSSTVLTVNGQSIQFYLRDPDGDYAHILGIPLLSGRWPRPDEAGMTPRPVVITEDVALKAFGNSSPLGKPIVRTRDNVVKAQYVITGVIPSFKQNDYSAVEPGLFRIADPVDINDASRILFRIKDGKMADFFTNIENDIFKAVDKQKWFIFWVNSLQDMRTNVNATMHTQFYGRTLVSGIVIINVLLGFIGVLWYNMNLRRKETGLRMAVGAPRQMIRRQMITESLVLGFFGILPAVVLIIQVFLLKIFDFESRIFFFSLAMSLLVLPLLLVLSAWYPGWLASRISPATALHTE